MADAGVPAAIKEPATVPALIVAAVGVDVPAVNAAQRTFSVTPVVYDTASEVCVGVAEAAGWVVNPAVEIVATALTTEEVAVAQYTE